MRYLRIAIQLARMGVLRKTQFRVEFASQVIMDCVWYAAKIAVFEILFLYTGSIATWSLQDIRVFLGFVFVSDAFMMMWLGSRWRFGQDLKDGKLDPFRVRPASTVFLYFFQQFSPEAALNMIVACSYLGFGLVAAGALSLSTLPIVAWAILLSWWAMTVMTVFFSVIEFHVVSSDISSFLTHALDPAATNPLDVFGGRLRMVFLYVIPVGLLAHGPASLALGRYDVADGFLHSAWMLGFGFLAFKLWNRGFRRYESAMS
jgi:ABC-type uncharacterized transport system permease subunit